MSWLARLPPPVHPAPAAVPAMVTAIPGEGQAERLPKRGFGGGRVAPTPRDGDRAGPTAGDTPAGYHASPERGEGGGWRGSEGRAAPPASTPQRPPASVRPRGPSSPKRAPEPRGAPAPAPLHPRLDRASPRPSVGSPSARLTSIRSPIHAAMFPGSGRPGLGRLAVPPRQRSE